MCVARSEANFHVQNGIHSFERVSSDLQLNVSPSFRGRSTKRNRCNRFKVGKRGEGERQSRTKGFD